MGRGYRLPKTSDVLCVPMRVSHICHFDVYKGVISISFSFYENAALKFGCECVYERENWNMKNIESVDLDSISLILAIECCLRVFASSSCLRLWVFVGG